MTYLARIYLNMTRRTVIWDIRNHVAVHKRVMSVFPHVDSGKARESLAVLWRLDTNAEQRPFLLVQSNTPGLWDNLPAGWATSVEVKEIDRLLDGLRTGQRCRFLLRANATRKINSTTGEDGQHRNGQRVPLRSPESALEWLERKGQEAGFELVKKLSVEQRGDTAATQQGSQTKPEQGVNHFVDVRLEPSTTGKRGGAFVTIEPIRFEGQLIVTDPARLAQAVRTGIGPAKAYGCGLLSLVPMLG